jgi:hypothetical protein
MSDGSASACMASFPVLICVHPCLDLLEQFRELASIGIREFGFPNLELAFGDHGFSKFFDLDEVQVFFFLVVDVHESNNLPKNKNTFLMVPT